MKDFILAALPWVIMGLALAIFFAFSKQEMKNNYGTEGMCIGMCLGSAIGTFEVVNIGLSLSMGMLIGLAIGTSVKKEK